MWGEEMHRSTIAKKPKEKIKLVGLAFILPAVIYTCLWVVYPLINNIILSFQKVTLTTLGSGGGEFIGLAVYKKLFSTSVFPIAIKNTIIYTVANLLFQFPIGFALAMFYSKKFKTAEFFRGFSVVAWILPMVAVAGIFKFMFNGDVGVINYILRSMGLINENVQWLTDARTAMGALVFTNVWKGIPFNIMLMAAAITTLPEDVYEAASIDGVSSFQKFRHITIPLLKPAMMSVIVLGFIYTFKVFDIVYIMTSGGPGNATEVLSTLAYRYSFTDYDFSKGAAVSNVLFILLFIVGLIYIRIVSKEED